MISGTLKVKKYYIKKDFQKRFIYEYFSFTFLGAILANWLLYVLLEKGIDDAFYKAHIGIATTGDVVLSPLIMANIAVISASLAAVLAFTLLRSWRINKRFHCLAEGIEGLKKGDLTIQVEAYRRDQLTEVADAFNKAVKHLRSKMAHLKSGIGEIEDAARGIQAEREDAIEILLKKIEIVEGHLSAFKIQRSKEILDK